MKMYIQMKEKKNSRNKTNEIYTDPSKHHVEKKKEKKTFY